MEPTPIVVEFPLRGEWVAYHTPAARVPSHGTDQLGQRYAYDFMRIERSPGGWKFHRASTRRYHLLGSPLDGCYAWGEPIHAPFDGAVIAARDGWPERDPVHFIRDMGVVLKNAFTFNPNRPNALLSLLGNHVILKMAGSDVYSLFAHGRTGSIQVREGDAVRVGQHLADVGHSGNSTAPHLHFHLMDGPDILAAGGLPCSFREYEALRHGTWSKVTEGIPAKREFVRYSG